MDIFDRLATAESVRFHGITKICIISIYLLLLSKQHYRQVESMSRVMSAFYNKEDMPPVELLMDATWSALHQLHFQLATPHVSTWIASRQKQDKSMWSNVIDAYAQFWPDGTTSRESMLERCAAENLPWKFTWGCEEKQQMLDSL